MDLQSLKGIISTCEIIFTKHAITRAEQRRVRLSDVRKNLHKPDKLIMADKITPCQYNCWFELSESLGHKYGILINEKTRVITVIKIRSRWQREVEKHAKKIPKRLRL